MSFKKENEVVGTHTEMAFLHELKLATLTPGLFLAARLYGNAESPAADAPRFVFLHGWMDNCASFERLIPALQAGLPPSSQLLAVDLIGHGQSSALPGGFYTLPTHAALLAEALTVLGGGWEEGVFFVCHSMGGAVGILCGGAWPERCRGLILLDSAGPITRSPSEAPDHMSKFAGFKAALAARPGGSAYASIDGAVQARLLTVATYPGNQTLSMEAARSLVERMVVQGEDGKWRWTFDSVIKGPSILGLTEEAVLEFCTRIGTCIPVLLVRAEKGWPYPEESMAQRVKAMGAAVVRVPGGHHAHLDPLTAAEVSNQVLTWLSAKGV